MHSPGTVVFARSRAQCTRRHCDRRGIGPHELTWLGTWAPHPLAIQAPPGSGGSRARATRGPEPVANLQQSAQTGPPPERHSGGLGVAVLKAASADPAPTVLEAAQLQDRPAKPEPLLDREAHLPAARTRPRPTNRA